MRALRNCARIPPPAHISGRLGQPVRTTLAAETAVKRALPVEDMLIRTWIRLRMAVHAAALAQIDLIWDATNRRGHPMAA